MGIFRFLFGLICLGLCLLPFVAIWMAYWPEMNEYWRRRLK